MKKIIFIAIAATSLLSGCSGENSSGVPATETSAASPQAAPEASTSSAHASEVLIPRSMPGDKGRYYLLDKSKSGNVVTATHKRVGVDSVGFTKTETDCSTMRMREIGYSEESAAAITNQPTDWFDLVPGSSKADLANFVCKQ